MVHRSEVLHGLHFQNHYQRVLPSLKLTPFVESFWRLESYRSLPMGVAEHFMPGLAARLVFPFANYCEYLLLGQETKPMTGPHLVLPHAWPITCLHPDSEGILGVTLTPGGLAALEIKADLAGIQLLSELQKWEAEMAKCENFEQQCQILNAALSDWLCPTTESDMLTRALNQFEWGKTIAETATELALSVRTLQRLFQKSLGHSPRTCQRVLRLRRTLLEVWQKPEMSIWDTDYCDYSHFFKEFKALMGLSPSAYLRQF